jgi:hypothetical protein
MTLHWSHLSRADSSALLSELAQQTGRKVLLRDELNVVARGKFGAPDNSFASRDGIVVARACGGGEILRRRSWHSWAGRREHRQRGISLRETSPPDPADHGLAGRAIKRRRSDGEDFTQFWINAAREARYRHGKDEIRQLVRRLQGPAGKETFKFRTQIASQNLLSVGGRVLDYPSCTVDVTTNDMPFIGCVM